MLRFPRPACSARRSRSLRSNSPRPRSRLRPSLRSCHVGSVLRLPHPRRRLSLLLAEGVLRRPPPFLPGALLRSKEPVVSSPPRPLSPLQRVVKEDLSGPETGDLEMEGIALQEVVKAPLPPPEEGRLGNLLFHFSVPPTFQSAPTNPQKERIPLPSLGLQMSAGDTSGLITPPRSPTHQRRTRATHGLITPPRSQPVGDSYGLITHRLPPPSPEGASSGVRCLQQSLPYSTTQQRTQVSVITHNTAVGAAVTHTPAITSIAPAAGTPIVPLVPLARYLGAWEQLPSPSRWLLRTIRLGYAIQFARRPPKFSGVRFTTVRAADAHVLRAEIAVLLAKDAIQPVPPAEMRSGFYSPYFIVPKKSGGLRPILDLRSLNRALHRMPFKMLTPKRIFPCIRPNDWFASIDLKDAYFHVSILPRHRPFLRFAFEGRAYQYKVLPFGLSLSPRVFTKVVEGALKPLRERGVRILAYLDDWLIIAQTRQTLCDHRDLTLKHLARLGLRVNWEKSKLCPVRRISFLGMELDSIDLTARLTEARVQSILTCLNTFKSKSAVPRAWLRGIHRVIITPACRRTFTPWLDRAFLRAGVPLRQVSRHAIVCTDASDTGWGATYDGSIKMRPVNVNKENEPLVFQNLYAGMKNETRSFKFKVGDVVRISKVRGTFAKGYEQNYTEEYFTVAARVPRQPPVYRLSDYDGEIIDGVFYEEELQKIIVCKDKAFKVEKILGEKKQGRNTLVLVKWLGWPAKFNSYVDKKALVDLQPS
nr:uncharacterized protein LOC129435990 [Misgurnus anguillicaudatus]